MKQLGGTDQKRLHREWKRRTEGRLALLLDGVQTPWNVGSIVREAAAFRVEHLWVCGPTTPEHPSSRKTSLGTERYVPWTAAPAEEAVATAVAAGFRLVGVELAEGAAPLPFVDLTGPVCLVLGHEDHGVSRKVLARCHVVTYIPQGGRVGSLNVAAATAIALYEVRRQEWSRVSPSSDVVGSHATSPEPPRPASPPHR